MQKELTFKDMLLGVLRSGKQVALIGLAFAVLGGCWGGFQFYKTQEKLDPYEDRLLRYSTQLSIAGQNIQRDRDEIADLSDYMQNSVYYGLDAYSKGICQLTFYVDTGYEVRPELTLQSPDRTPDVVAAYCRAYRNAELADTLRGILGQPVEDRYLYELVSVNAAENMVTIRTCHSDAQTATQMADAMYQWLQSHVADSICAHTNTVVTRYAYYMVDSELQAAQIAKSTRYDEVVLKLDEDQLTLETLQKNPPKAFNLWNLVKRAVKYGLIGAILGVIAGCVWAVAREAVEGRLYTAREAEDRYTLPVLAALPPVLEGKRWFGKTIARLEGDAHVCATPEDAAALLTSTLKDMLPEGGTLTMAANGNIPEAVLTRLCTGLEKRLGTPVTAAGDPLTQQSALDAVKEAVAVVAVMRRGETADAMDALLRRLESIEDTKVMGILLV